MFQIISLKFGTVINIIIVISKRRKNDYSNNGGTSRPIIYSIYTFHID